jgi:hypothetical protein
MSGKKTDKNQIIEEALESYTMLQHFVEGLGEVIEALNKSESADHANDVTRNDVFSFLLEAVQDVASGANPSAQKNLNAAIQRLRKQEREDLEDDIPRQQARDRLIKVKNKAVDTQARLKEILKKLSKKNEK